MLTAHACRQPAGAIKRWYSDQHNDLFIWLNEAGQITAFQFSYNKSSNEHLFSWSEQHGYSHDRIDDGEDVYLQIKMSPIMVPNGAVDCVQVAATFLRISTALEPQLIEFIHHKLLACQSATPSI